MQPFSRGSLFFLHTNAIVTTMGCDRLAYASYGCADIKDATGM
jgi:hypothetical protein